MTIRRRSALAGAISLAAAPAILAQGALAQPAWPTRPVKIIVNYAPGGSTDNATRAFAERLSQMLGQQFVIENKGGASGAVGVEAGVRSPADGYTFFVTPVASITILPNARPTPYDPFKDMVPVSWYTDATLVVAIHPSIPATNMAEFVAYAKKNPGKLAFGSSGLGTLTQMVCEVTNREAGIDMLHVPYRGGAESLTDFLAGQVQVFSEGNVLPHVKTGKARLLAIVDSVRHPEFPDVPTLKEIYPNADILNWFGMFAPVGTPQPIVQAMAAAMAKVSKDPTLQAHLLRLALRANDGGPDALAARVKQDFALYGQLARDLKLKLD